MQQRVKSEELLRSRSACQTNHTVITELSSWAATAAEADTAAIIAELAKKAMPIKQLIGPRTEGGPGTIYAAVGLPSARWPATRSTQAALSSREEFATGQHTN